MSTSSKSTSNQDNEADQGDSSQPHEESHAAATSAEGENGGGGDFDGGGQEIMGHLALLDNEYQSLSEKENALLQAHARLQKEEQSLASAVALAEDHSKPPQRPRKKEDEAALRLEDALMGANNAADDDESTKASGAVFSVGSFMDKSLPSFKRDSDDDEPMTE